MSLWQSNVLLTPNPLLAPSSQPRPLQNKELFEFYMQNKAWAVSDRKKQQFITDICPFQHRSKRALQRQVILSFSQSGLLKQRKEFVASQDSLKA